MKILRKREAAARLGCGSLSTFHEKYVKTGRVKLIYLGKRSVGVLESDIDRLIGDLVAESAAHPIGGRWRQHRRRGADARRNKRRRKEKSPPESGRARAVRLRPVSHQRGGQVATSGPINRKTPRVRSLFRSITNPSAGQSSQSGKTLLIAR